MFSKNTGSVYIYIYIYIYIFFIFIKFLNFYKNIKSILKVRNASRKLYVNVIKIVTGRFNHRHDPVDETFYFRLIDERGSLRSGARLAHCGCAEVSNYDGQLVRHSHRCIRISRRCRHSVTPHVKLRVSSSCQMRLISAADERSSLFENTLSNVSS